MTHSSTSKTVVGPPTATRRGHRAPRLGAWWTYASSVLTGACVLLIVAAALRDGAMLPAVKHPASAVATGLAVTWGVLYLVRRLKVGHQVIPPAWLVSIGLLVAGAAWVLMSALWSLDPVTSIWEGLTWVGAVGFLVAGRTLPESTRFGRTIIPVVLVLLGTVFGIVSLVSYAQGSDMWVLSVGGVRHLVGPLGYANAFAGLLIVTLCASAVLVLDLFNRTRAQGRRLAGTAALAIAVAVQVAAVALTRSRGALAALAAAAVLGLFFMAARQIRWSARDRNTRGRAAASIVALLLLAAVVTVATMEIRSLDLSIQSTEQHRVQLWQSAVDTAQERPTLGWGAGTFYEAYSEHRIGPPSRFAHNLFLQHWVETGIIGCVLLAAILIALLWPRWKMPWRRSFADRRWWLWIGATSLVFQNMIDLSLYFPALFWLFFLVAGSLFREPATDAQRSPTPPETQARPKGASRRSSGSKKNRSQSRRAV